MTGLSMPKQVVEMLVGAGILLFGVAFVAFAFKGASPDADDGYRVVAVFNDASGLGAGTDIRIAGIKIGSVVDKQFDAEAFEAIVTFVVDNHVKLPTDSQALIEPDGLLGGNFVLVKPGSEQSHIPPGGRFTATRGAVNVIDMIGGYIFDGTGD